jgi:hypothetical protein
MSTVVQERAWEDEEIRDCITVERLRSYLRAADDELPRALALYEWNIRASEAVLGLTAIVEVVVRNAIDRELRAWSVAHHGTACWFDHVPLDPRGSADLRHARARATRNGQEAEIHGKVIAELTFGFWRYLTESRYLSTLWMPALQHAFPRGTAHAPTRRRNVAHLMAKLQFARNRAAHHEPIHRRDVHDDLRAARSLLRWVSRSALAWFDDVQTISDINIRDLFRAPTLRSGSQQQRRRDRGDAIGMSGRHGGGDDSREHVHVTALRFALRCTSR